MRLSSYVCIRFATSERNMEGILILRRIGQEQSRKTITVSYKEIERDKTKEVKRQKRAIRVKDTTIWWFSLFHLVPHIKYIIPRYIDTYDSARILWPSVLAGEDNLADQTRNTIPIFEICIGSNIVLSLLYEAMLKRD